MKDIPVLTEAIDMEGRQPLPVLDNDELRAAIVTETMKLVDSLVHQATKDIEAILYERVFDRMRAELPGLVERILEQHVPVIDTYTGRGHG